MGAFHTVLEACSSAAHSLKIVLGLEQWDMPVLSAQGGRDKRVKASSKQAWSHSKSMSQIRGRHQGSGCGEE